LVLQAGADFPSPIEQPARGVENLLDRNVIHADGVVTAAFGAWPAVNGRKYHLATAAKRPGLNRILWTKKGDHGHLQSRSHVHRAGVAPDEKVSPAEQTSKLLQVRQRRGEPDSSCRQLD
jgi:hypothetical protein